MDIEIDRYTKVVLYVIDGDHGLPSSDPFSMDILLNIKLNNCNRIEVRKSRMNTNADLPKITVNGTTVTHPAKIRKIIEKITKNKINQRYTKVELSRISAYFAHAEKYLATAALLHYWGIEENAVVSTNNYAQGMWFPFGILYSRSMKKKMAANIEMIVGGEDMKVFIDRKYTELDAYFKDISQMLANKKYLLGDHPTTLDLYICSHLAPAFRVQYPNSQFMNILTRNTVITDYLRNFLTKYAPPKEPASKEIPVDNDRASIFLLLTAGITAIGAMTLFAYSHGIIRR